MKIGLRRLAAFVPAAALLAAVGVAAAPGPGVPAAGAASGDAADSGTEYGRMMLLLDSSGSMAEPAGGGQSKIAAAKSALHTVIEGLPDDAQVGLRVFGATVFSRTDKGACTDSQLAVEPGADNRDELARAVDGYKPYGETPIPYALQQAAKDLGDEGARSIVLVSDGESTCAPDPCQVAADLQKGGIDLQIDVVGLSVSGQARRQLQCIAENGNGHYYDADSAGDIESRLTRVAERAVRPFTLSGAPISGGSESDPTPVTVGDWTDRLGQGGKSYVFERRTEGTTLRVSAISQGERAFADGLNLEIVGPDGARCSYGINSRTFDARNLIGVEASAGPPVDGSTATPDCGQVGAYVITVTRTVAARTEVPFGLRVAEEPPIDDVGFTPPAGTAIDVTAPQVSGRATHVEGGSSFANATELGSGSWSSTVVPGEVLLYRVPLEFGQAARVSVTFPRAKGGVADAFGRFPPLAVASMFDPMQGELGTPNGANLSAQPDGATLLTATPPVSRAPIDLPTKLGGGGDYTTAGDYYLMVSVQQKDYTVEIPFDIAVEVVGDAAAGPTYADGATWSVAAGSGEGGTPPSDQASDGASDGATEPPGDADASAGSGTDDGSSTMAVAGGVVGVVGVAAVIAAVLLWRRRQA